MVIEAKDEGRVYLRTLGWTVFPRLSGAMKKNEAELITRRPKVTNDRVEARPRRGARMAQTLRALTL
jgi:hypothetical protein